MDNNEERMKALKDTVDKLESLAAKGFHIVSQPTPCLILVLDRDRVKPKKSAP